MAGYTVAVLSDMHGNDAAFVAALADLATVPHDATVLAGDLLVNGPRPREVLARIRDLNVPVVYGNTEYYLLQNRPDPVVQWLRAQLSADELAYLSSLPLAHRITPPGGVSPGDDLLIVHATPTDVDSALITALPPIVTAITATTPEDEAAALLGDARANLILYGHIHYFSSGMIRGQRVASIGSVGFPFDGDRRAAYALVAWDGTAWQVTPRRVEYDFRPVVAELHAFGVPRADLSERRLIEATFLPIP